MKPAKAADSAGRGLAWGAIAGSAMAAMGKAAAALQQALQTLHLSAPSLSMFNLPGCDVPSDAW